MLDTDNYVTCDGSPIYYNISGNPKGKPLVMLHGGLGSSGDLCCLHQYLTPEYRLISMDFRGHGKSPLAGPTLSYAQYQRDVLQLLSYLGIQRFSLFGFSDGGIVGYRLAAQQADRVECLITLGAQWRLEPEDPSRALLAGLTTEFWQENFPTDVKVYKTTNPEPDFQRLLETVKSVWLDTTETGYPQQRVKNIRCPTLIIRGDSDFLFSLREAVDLTEILSKVHFANIPFAEHDAHKAFPELVGTISKQFLSKAQGA